MKYIPVLSIAGSDCSGGAGLQADLKTIAALGGYGMSAVTAITVQNTLGVSRVHPVPPRIVEEQIRAVMTDIRPQAIKIGMLTDEEQIHRVTDCLTEVTDIPVVLDPVMVSSSGYPLLQPSALHALQTELLPRCTLLTPNLPEAALLSGLSLDNDSGVAEAAARILTYGCRAVLIKGGHRTDHRMTDYLAVSSPSGTETFTYTQPRIDTSNTHGTGCTLSSAIATLLAQGLALPDAVRDGKAYLTAALRHGRNVRTGQGHGPLNHFFDPQKQIIRPEN